MPFETRGSWLRAVVLVCCLSTACLVLLADGSQDQTQPVRPVLATTDFTLTGLAVAVTPGHQDIPRHTASLLTTRLAGLEASQSTGLQLNPDYRIRGELVGPSLSSPKLVETAIGSPLIIPPLALPGDHLVANLRVVDTGAPGAPTIAEVIPDTCSISVIDQLLVSQVSVRQLGYDEILASGISVNEDSYSYYAFTLALTTSSQAYQISIPVAMPKMEGEPVVGPARPSVKIGTDAPDVVPVLLKAELPPGSDAPDIDLAEVRIPGLLVFPGRIALLHQYFEAIVIVGNGAPSGTPLVVHTLKARADLPQAPNPLDNPLRVAAIQPGGPAEELELHNLGSDGVYGTADDSAKFAPGESGQASFLIEGLKEGHHTVTFKLQGTLEGLPVGPVTVRGEASGAVLVRDAAIAVSFTHPGVVRAGQDYDLGITLFNSGSSDLLGAFADLTPASVIGADLVNPPPNDRQSFPTTIKPGESGTVTWRLKARVTGAVTASYMKVEGASQASLKLVTGVGDRNVPLSPDSLLLPDAVRYLPTPVVDASSALLGQAWSIATAPSGSLPDGVTSISKQVVLDRAIELGVAGLRVRFGEDLGVSLVTLLRDWLGELQDAPDAGFLEALCGTKTGFNWQDALGTQLRSLIGSQSAPAFHKAVVEPEMARSRFLSVLVTHAETSPLAGARLIDPDGRSVGSTGPLDRFGSVGAGSMLRLNNSQTVSPGSRGAFLLVTRPQSGTWTLELTAWTPGAVDISMLLPVDDDLYRRLGFTNVSLAAGGVYRVKFDPYSSSGAIVELCSYAGCSPSGPGAAVELVAEAPPRLVGALQVGPAILEAGDRFGRMAAVLFSKAVSPETAEIAGNYSMDGGTLVGSDPPLSVGLPIGILGAKLNFGNRFAFLRPASPIGPFIDRTISITGVTDTRGLVLSPEPPDIPIEMTVSPAGVPPGGYLTGRVLDADGIPVVGAEVSLWDIPCIYEGAPYRVATVLSDNSGRYAFDYVINSHCSPPYVIAANPVNGASKGLSSRVLYHGHHIVLDLVFLARGNVEGLVTMAGQPVKGAQVLVTANADPAASQLVHSDSTGKYFALDIPVGRISVLAAGTEGLANATGFGSGWIDSPGKTTTVDIWLQNTSGSVEGKVIDYNGKPVSGMLVIADTEIPGIADPVVLGFCYTETDGTFQLKNLPLAQIRIYATDYNTGLKVAQQVQLTSQAPSATGITLAMPGYGAIRGRVIDQAGHYLPVAEVKCGSTVVSTDLLGYYHFPVVLAGTHDLTATNTLTGMTGSVKVTVQAGQEKTGVDVMVLAAGTIKGTVLIVRASGLPAVPVVGAQVTYDGRHVVVTDAQGSYLLSNVPPGRSFTLRFVHPNNRLGANQTVKLAAGETQIRNFTFHPASIGGKVFQPDGQTGAVARLTIYTPVPYLKEGPNYGLLSAEQPLTTYSAGDGTYLLGNLNPAGYRIFAFNDFFPTPVGRIGVLPPGAAVGCNLTLVDSLAGKIKGRVFKPDGLTPAGAEIEVTLGGGHLADATVKTDSAGDYAFPEVFAAGTYNLTADDPVTGYSSRTRIAVEVNKDCIADIRLLGRGSIQVRVVDAAGAAVESGTVTVTGLDYPNATLQADLFVGGGGAVLFENLPEGPYAVIASRQGLSGRVPTLVTLSGISTVTVQLQPCGTVTGRVLMPDGTTPVGMADVRLIIGGRAVGYTISSDDDQEGTFVFSEVPLGDFKLEAFDNRSTRTGRTAGRVSQNGESVTADIGLLAIGTVRGQVTSNNSPVDHAYVTLNSGEFGFFGTTLKATTDAAGNYRFPGIPAGKFTISVAHPSSGLTGYAEGTLQNGPEPLPDKIVNIALELSASIDGIVRDHQGTTVAGAQVTVTIGSRKLESASRQDGTFRLDFVPLGDATIRAQAPSGYDRGQAGPVSIAQPGATIQVEIRFDGVGTVKGDALDGDGVTALTLGTVTLTNAEWPVPVILATPVHQGKYELLGVPAGSFSLKLTVPTRTAIGTGAGALSAGQTLTIPLVLEPAGKVNGKVVRPDGTTPAVGADVTVRVTRPTGGTTTLATTTDAGGIYKIDQVPLGTIEVSVGYDETDGIASISGLSLATNGQLLEVPLLILDESPIGIQSVSPTNGSMGVSRSTAVTVTFTEPAKPSTVNGTSFKLFKGPLQVGAAISLSADGLVATLTPALILADNCTYTVVVTRQVTDLVGRQLPAEFRSTFTTPDETPAWVVSVDPTVGTQEVALDKVLQVTFNEALDPQQSFAGVVRLFPSGQPQALVPLVVSLGESNTQLTAQPGVPLVDSTSYVIKVTGQKDLAGNIQSAVYTSGFSTVDRTKPVITSVYPEGQVIFSRTPFVEVSYHDDLSGIDTTSLILKLDGQDIKAGAEITQSYARYQVPQSAPLAPGSHIVEARVSDLRGNQSNVKSASFTIDNIAPQVLSFTVAGLPASDGMIVTVFRPIFAATFSDNGFIDVTATRLRLGSEGQPLVEVPAAVTSTELTYQPDVNLAGVCLAELVVTDAIGNSTTVGPIRIVMDLDAPDIMAFAPVGGNQHGGTTLILTGNRLLNAGGKLPEVWIGGNQAWVTAGTAGSPDQVTIVTPPGAPGFASIKITTDRGTGTLPAAFLYEPDLQTPFAVEPDTVLLWHLDEPTGLGWAAVDSGPFAIAPDPDSDSLAVPARFGLGRTGAVWGYLWSEEVSTVLDFGISDFTLDCWFKSSLVTKTYLLIGKQIDTSGYGISLLPSGSLQGWLQDHAGVQWIVETQTGLSLADDQWHSASLVVDRFNHKLSIFVDGVEEAASTEPAGFGKVGDEVYQDGDHEQYLAVGEEDYRDTANLGSWAFPGVIDEVRISSSAHSSERIQQLFLGSQTVPLSVSRIRPETLMAGSKREVIVEGYNLCEVQGTLIDSSGTVYSAEPPSSSATKARIRVDVPASAAPGPAQLQLQSPLGLVTVPVRVLDRERSLLRQEADTLLLWHLDEPGDGAVTVSDSGPFSLNGNASSSSRSVSAMFGTARDRASGPAIDFSTSSFTVEGWVLGAEMYGCGIELGPDWTGNLIAHLVDTAGIEWSLVVPPNRYDESRREWTQTIIDDGQWHFVAMSVDRTAGQLTVYLDGKQVGVTAAPSDFGALPGGSVFSLSSPWDELRISSTARSSEQIWQAFSGEHEYQVAVVNPWLLHRSSTAVLTQDLVIEGFRLEQIDCQLLQGDQPADATVSVIERSYGRAVVRVTVNPGIQLGTARLAVSSAGFPDQSLDLTVVEPSPFVADTDTRLLWRFDESANGATTILDSGPLVLKGTSGAESKAVEGRFEGGRELASITGGRETALQFDSSSFSIDLWVKTSPVPDEYALVQRTSDQYYKDFAIVLLPSGKLQAEVLDGNGAVWQAATRLLKYETLSGWISCVVDDGRWHSVTVVVDRTSGLLSIYLDGLLRASASAPSGFASVGRAPWGELKAGYRRGTSYCPSCPTGFPGVLDEVRVSGRARSSSEIWQEFSAIGPSRVTRVSPSVVERNRSTPAGMTTELTVEGFGVQGVTGRLTRSDVPVPGVDVSVSSSTHFSASLTVTVLPDATLGPAMLIVEYQGQEIGRQRIDILEPGPLAREFDTVALWRLDESEPAAVTLADSSVFATRATSSANSTSAEGRFGKGRTRANLQADDDFGCADFGVSSFTVQCWMKTEPVTRSYILAGKSSTNGYNGRYKISLLTDGRLRAWLTDGTRQWQAEAGPVFSDPTVNELKSVVDNRWHMVTMVVDRTAGVLRLYLDGLERASASMPAGFTAPPTGYQLRAGIVDSGSSGTGPTEFPGVLDEIRISSTAHTAEKVAADFFGQDAPQVTSLAPGVVARGSADFSLTLHGYGLSGATVQFDNPTIGVGSTSAATGGLEILLTVPASTPSGPARFTISDPAGRTCSAELLITAPQPFSNGSQTDNQDLVLWHLDESDPGAIPIVGAGDLIPAAVGGTAAAASLPAPGRFGGGRTLANIVAGAGFGTLDPGANSFSIECWFKTRPVGRAYALVSRSATDGYSGEIALSLLSSGALRADVRDASNRLWQAETKVAAYDQAIGAWNVCVVDDEQWHLATMVVDRSASLLLLYVDGQLRASAAPPTGFSTLRNMNQRVRAGLRNLTISGTLFPDSDQFPGVIDEVRFLRRARTADEIRADFGLAPALSPSGWAQTVRSQQLADGQNRRTLARSGVRKIDQPNPDAEQESGDTLLLWHLDERANGAVRIAGAAETPQVIGGTASPASIAEAGRFQGGRTQAGIVADSDNGALDLGDSSFTLDFWLRTDPVFSTYTLLGRDGASGEAKDFGVSVLPSGHLKAWLYDTSGTEWAAETELRVDDSAWRLVTMSVDRENGWLYLLVDDEVVDVQPAPPGFGSLANQGQPLRAGHIDIYGPAEFAGPPEFPGVLDEVRILKYARKPAEGR